MAQIEEAGDLDRLVLHEIGHVLGFGTLWSQFDLLRQPTGDTSSEVDTHFAGPLAIEAFDRAGGRGYIGEKVPVDNNLPVHWRESVLDTELMTPGYNPDGSNPLSAITLQSLADMGYTVDSSQAEAFQLPAQLNAAMTEPTRNIDYGDDILNLPLVVVDPDGRVVRIIRR